MKKLVVFAAIVLLTTTSGSSAKDPALGERTLLDGKISLLVPEGFEVMDEEMLRAKYPAEQRPTTVLTNPEGSVNVAVNHTQNALQPSQISEFHRFMEKTFRNLYPSAQWNRSEMTVANGNEFFVLDLRTPAIDTEVRNIIVGTSHQGRLLLITFNCTKELESDWAAVGRQIVESVSINR